jgi:hypothetical protein
MSEIKMEDVQKKKEIVQKLFEKVRKPSKNTVLFAS